uniref:Transthyretin-like family-containing protein n=1 Tax=Parastrongyloides trichosuri TaxID=131310 RepID=A0A0N5A5F9_PARTI
MKFGIKICIFISLFLTCRGIIKQSIEVTGRFFCLGKPANNVYIQLMEEDLFSDDILARSKSDSNGFFSMFGIDKELSFIDPYISFKLECPKGTFLFGNNTVKLYVPRRAFKYFRGKYRFSYDFKDIELNKIYLKKNYDINNLRYK